MKAHDKLAALPLVLLYFFLCPAKVFGFLVLDKQLVFALKILHDLRAAATCEAR
jgi:hypothetical protein